MGEFWGRLFDTSGFTPRKDCGDWSDELVWLHVGSDLFIWLAYLSIPIVLLYFTRRRAVPFTSLFVLAAAFILFCGFTHFTDALMFTTPAYRFAGVLKAATAVVSWGMVLALVPAVPRITAVLATGGGAVSESREHRPLAAARPDHWARGYIIALLAATLAVLVRAALDPILQNDRAYVISLLAVVYVGWQCGFGPGVAALLVSLSGMIYFFVWPRVGPDTALSDLTAAGLFFFCGVGCAALGGSNRAAQARVRASLAEVTGQRAELLAEMGRRRTAEAELREREADFRLMADNISQFAWMTDADGAIFWYNRRWFEYTGTKMDEMRGWGWKAVHHPAHVERVTEKFVRHVRAGEPWEDTFPLRGADGRYRWFLSRARPVRDDGGEIVRWFGTNTDITAQREAEEAARVEEARFRALAEAVPQIVWVTRPDGYHEYYNPRWYQYTGVPDGSTDGEGWSGVFHPDDQDRAWARWRHSLTTGEYYDIEYRLRRHDGVYRWMLGLAQPQRDPAGAIIRWFGTCTDIDDAKRQEQQLRQAADRFQTLTESIPQMVWNADAGGHISYFNTRWREYTGLTAGAALDTWWRQVVHPADAPGMEDAWLRAMGGVAAPFTREVRVRRATDGEYRWFLTACVPLLRDDGSVDQWVGTLADIDDQKRQSELLDRLVQERTAELRTTNVALVDQIDERKRAEEQVQAVARELRRSNGELEQFAYVASHDLQEPLRKIQAFGDLLGNKFAAQLPDQGRDYVGKMQGSAGRMSRLIDDLLTFSRVTTHARPFARVDLNVILAEVLEDLEFRIEKTGGTVDAGPLPPVEADPTQMRQLFLNLLANALKFSQPGVPPVVTVRGERIIDAGDNGRPAEAVRVTVADNGIGFDERHKDRIFQVFQRLHGRDEYDGTGVGLAVCKKIVDRHGGTIVAHGRPDHGATFVIVLPVSQPLPTANTPPPVDR